MVTTVVTMRRLIVPLICLFHHCLGEIYFKREHSLSKPYQGSGMTIPNWDFSGTTIVTSQYIRLTPDEQSRRGSLWNSAPIKSANWEVHLEFRVFGRGKELFGDGLAFWYARDALKTGEVFGNEEFFSGLAVFLDTYANQNGPHGHQHPYISAMVNNGSLKYDHDRDGTHTELAGCEGKFRGVDHPTFVMIRYQKETVTVQTDIEGKNEWKECFSVGGVRLPTGYYIGVTAATGDLSDNHDVISVKTFELDSTLEDGNVVEDRSKIIPSAKIHADHREHVHDPPAKTSGLKIFFFVLLAIFVVVAAVIGGFWYYNEQQTKRGRFY